jgi:hypothetical protein
VLLLLLLLQVFDFWPQSLSGFARKQRAGLGLLVGRWGTPLPRKVRKSCTVYIFKYRIPNLSIMEVTLLQGSAVASLNCGVGCLRGAGECPVTQGVVCSG